MKRFFLSTHPFFEAGAINGRKQANAGFMRALFTLDPFDEYHFFVAHPGQLESQWAAHYQLPALRRGAARAFPRTDLAAALRGTPYHVCHLSDPITDFVQLAAARNRWAQNIFPLTATNHTLSYTSYAAVFQAHLWPGCSPRDAIGCNSLASREVLRRCFAHLAAASEAGASTPAVQALPIVAPQLEVIPMGAVPRSAQQDQEGRVAMRARLHLDEDSVLLLLFGRIALDDKMDPQPLLMALHRLQAGAEATRSTKDVHLVISGFAQTDDNAPAFLESVARMLHIKVRVLPNPSPVEKEQLFAAADIFLSPSENMQETFGLTLVEAAMAGLPVIASDWDGYRDIVVPGETGLLVPTLAPAHTPELDTEAQLLFDNQHHFLRSQRTVVHVPALAEAIQHLAEDAPLRRRMGEAARDRALSLFTWETVAHRWLAFWEELRAVPLSPERETQLRAARHPLHLPFGQIYAPFATAALGPHDLLHCTDMGLRLREGRLPLEALGKLPPGITAETLRPLLVLARKPMPLEQLADRSALPPEVLQTLVYWALKHDVLECAPPVPFCTNTDKGTKKPAEQ